ncbi:MAG: D-glycerate dehydrogenase [Candidatus Aminicenantes bacterium]|nr:D-glycerate dehydrogenase [Candidatus Aminicenantes bacterium]
MKPKVLITRNLLPEAMDYLKDKVDLDIGASGKNISRQELINKIKDKQGLLCLLVDIIDKKVIDAAPRLKIIANCAVGYDNIDIQYAQKKKIMVTNTPGVLTETTADLTWALIFATARKIPQAHRFTFEKRFTGWELDLFLGQEITGKTLGIIGMGRIGKAVASRACGFSMSVVYHDPNRLDKKDERQLKAEYLSLDELLSNADIVTLHTALTPQTKHLISTAQISLMKRDAILINVSRGPIVDEEALADALERKQIWAAGLDVFENEPHIQEKLFSLDNVILLPHIGSATYATRLKMSLMAASNLIQGLKGDIPENLIS